MTKESNIKVLDCFKVQDAYHLTYESEEVLTYNNFDILMARDSQNQSFIITLKSIEKNVLEVYMSVQYEKSIIGNIKAQLLFSPLTSIEGALEVIKITKMFPACHYDKIVAFQEQNNDIILVIELTHVNKKMKLTLCGIKENELKGYTQNNIILQLDFRNHQDGIEVEIDSMEGLHGTVICSNVKAEFVSDDLGY
ncbi:Imm50 family immunity protein [Aquimarina sp. 433]